jgi:hypothetical protein
LRLAVLVSFGVIVSCAAPLHLISNKPSQDFSVSTAIDADEDSVKILLYSLLTSFHDTSSQAILAGDWNRLHRQIAKREDSTGLPIGSSLSILFSLMKDRSFSIFTIAPATYEAMRAISNLPVVSCVLIRDFNPRQMKALDKSSLNTAGYSLLNEHTYSISCAIFKSIQSGNGKFTLYTNTGQVLPGIAGDTLLGQIFTGTNADSTTGYHQVVGLFMISQAPDAVINGELQEWYNMMPGSVIRPKVTGIH